MVMFVDLFESACIGGEELCADGFTGILCTVCDMSQTEMLTFSEL